MNGNTEIKQLNGNPETPEDIIIEKNIILNETELSIPTRDIATSTKQLYQGDVSM